MVSRKIQIREHSASVEVNPAKPEEMANAEEPKSAATARLDLGSNPQGEDNSDFKPEQMELVSLVNTGKENHTNYHLLIPKVWPITRQNYKNIQVLVNQF